MIECKHVNLFEKTKKHLVINRSRYKYDVICNIQEFDLSKSKS